MKNNEIQQKIWCEGVLLLSFHQIFWYSNSFKDYHQSQIYVKVQIIISNIFDHETNIQYYEWLTLFWWSASSMFSVFTYKPTLKAPSDSMAQYTAPQKMLQVFLCVMLMNGNLITELCVISYRNMKYIKLHVLVNVLKNPCETASENKNVLSGTAYTCTCTW